MCLVKDDVTTPTTAQSALITLITADCTRTRVTQVLVTTRGYVDSAPSQMQGGNEELQSSIHSEPVDKVFTLNWTVCSQNNIG